MYYGIGILLVKIKGFDNKFQKYKLLEKKKTIVVSICDNTCFITSWISYFSVLGGSILEGND